MSKDDDYEIQFEPQPDGWARAAMTPSSKDSERAELEAALQEYLARGKVIQEIPIGQCAYEVRFAIDMRAEMSKRSAARGAKAGLTARARAKP